MDAERAGVPVEGGEVPITVCRGSRTGPALVVVPSIFGVMDDLVEQLGALATDASLAVALDPFWRVEPGPIPYTEFQRAIARMPPFDRVKGYQDFLAVVEWAREQPGCDGRVVGLGICFGGPFCFIAAADGALQGVVTWHGSRLENYLGRAGEMTCPMSLHFGGSDGFVPESTVDKTREAFAGRGDVEIVVHPGADHGFSHPTGPAYQEAASAAGMAGVRRVLAAAAAA